MKKHFLSSLLILSVLACSPGQVQVSNQGPNNTPQPSGPSQPSDGGKSGHPGSAPAAPAEVFFEHVNAQGPQIDQVSGVDFLSSDATTTLPNGVDLEAPMDFSTSSVATAIGNSVVFLQSDGLMSSSLVEAPLDTLTAKSLYEFPEAAVAASVSLLGQQLAWIDSVGAVTVTDLSSGTAQAIKLPVNETAVRVLLSQSGSNLAVLTASGKLLTFNAPAKNAKPVAGQSSPVTWATGLNVSGVSEAAWSADGAHLAVIDTQGNLTVDGAKSVKLASADIHDLSWDKATGELLYWARLSSGAAEIRSLLPSAPTETTQAVITVPSTTRDGVVCPVRVAGELFFAEYTQGAYRIEKTSGGDVADFAVTSHEGAVDFDGFICPTVAQDAGQGSGKGGGK